MTSKPPSPPVTSNLPVGDWLLVEQLGYQPLGQVSGLSVFQTGAQWTGGGWSNSDRRNAVEKGISYELTTLTAALYQARHLALERMLDHAGKLGAHVIAGVQLHRTQPVEDSHSPIFEFKAIGTALAGRGPKPAKPVLSGLSGAELWQLHQAGYGTAGLVMGNCHWLHIMNRQSTQIIMSRNPAGSYGLNTEFEDLTQAMYQARSLAMGRLQTEARGIKASGVLGVTVTSDLEHTAAPAATPSVGVPFVWHFFCIGTAISKGNPADRSGTPFIASLSASPP